MNRHLGRRRAALCVRMYVKPPARRLLSTTTTQVQPRVRGNSNQRARLPTSPARTRFAPSPTGYLHLGSLRTALYNYLVARATGGQFILRIEDTDRTRIVEDAEQRLYEDLRWAGLAWDEGLDLIDKSAVSSLFWRANVSANFYPQSERLALYSEAAASMLASGRAYRCFCSKASHEHVQMAQSGQKQQLAVDPCLVMSKSESDSRAGEGQSHVVRFDPTRHVPQPTYDLVYGMSGKRPVGNFILMKSDGFPTYHFANVVDDHAMEITHVIRGSEWLISTPMHVALYSALGWKPPAFAHVPLLTDMAGQKLSKRLHDIGIDRYRADRVLPQALLNFVALHGWNPDTRSEVLGLDEMKKMFTFRFTKGDSKVDFKKLDYLQDKHLQRLYQVGGTEGRDIVEAELARLVPQIQDVIGKLESARKLDGKSTGDETTRWLVDSLGEPVHNGEDAVRNQAKALLRYEVDRGNGLRQNPLELVATYRFIFWQPSKTSLLEGIRSLSQKQRQPPELPESTTTQDTPATPDVGRRMAALLGGLERDLRLVNGELWEDMNLLENALKGLANTEGRLDPTWLDPGSARPLGIWKPLRWALSGGIPGPPVWACMVLLGKEETLRRLITASAIAKELDV